MNQLSIVSTPTLEAWDWETPWQLGIGGSEQSHIEMAERLALRGLPVVSYAPLPANGDYQVGPGDVTWRQSAVAKVSELPPGVVVNYRNPAFWEGDKSPQHRYWFVAQDVDYEGFITDEFIDKVDRYFCLCKQHVIYTTQKYPRLAPKIFVSSNGVRSQYITDFEKTAPKRNPHRLFYASSPDRGLQMLLTHWFRIRERFPDAELHVAYGFNNMETIVKAMGGNDYRAGLMKHLEYLLNQDGVTFTGRLPLDKLYHEWFEAGVWPYGTSWPETNCITCQDAQACGALPVTNNFWAVGEYVQGGYMVDGVPQQSKIVEHLWLDNLYRALDFKDDQDPAYRPDMMAWARKQYDWERVVTQWQEMYETDIKGLQ